MGGREAVRGFQHQFLWALEAVIQELDTPDSRVDAIRAESTGGDTADFVLLSGDRALTAVQAKSGVSVTYSLPDALKELLSLIRGDADRYLLLTNRPLTAPLKLFAELLDQSPSKDRLCIGALGLIKPDHPVAGALRGLDEEGWQRLGKSRITVDLRDRVELATATREGVRRLRRSLYSDRRGSWELAGLLTGHLLSFIQQRAASDSTQNIPMSEIRAELGLDLGALMALTARRDWSVQVNVPQRLGDVARNAQLTRILDVFGEEPSKLEVPVCVLSGLSGIGKSSLAAAWAADHADAYDAVFWVDAANSGTLAASFQGAEKWCTEAWGLSAPGDDVRDRVLAMLVASSRPWLMIFDNAMEQRQVAPWLPSVGLGHVLITTTDQAAWHGPRVARLPLSPMTAEEATQLLASRLDGVLPDDTQVVELAGALHYWPLALELACAYMNTCLGGARGISAYRAMIPRSLDDEDSIPVGYPVTLVRAILLLWLRLREGDESESPKEVAYRALRFAAHLHPGQIPLHLILGCVTLLPEQVFDAGIDGPFPVVGRYPLGEVVREMTRYGLAAVDTPFEWETSASGNPDSIGFTVSMNEIVQTVLRDQVMKDGFTQPVTSFLAFHLQNWLAGLMRARQLGIAVSLVPHAYAASDICLKGDYADSSIALLWGNTAALLAFVEDWQTAEEYLRAELNWLRTRSDGDLLFISSTQMLIQTLISRPDWPAREADVLDIVTEAIPRMVTAMEINEAEAISLGEHMVSMLHASISDISAQARVAGLVSALSSVIGLDSGEAARSRPGRAARVGELVAEGRLEEAESEALELLQEADPLMASNLLKDLAEIQARQQRWGAVALTLDAVRAAVRDNVMPTLTMGCVVQNLMLPCLSYLYQPGAEWVLHEVSAIAHDFVARGRVFRPQEAFYVEACHAVSAALRNDRDNATFMMTADWSRSSGDLKVPDAPIWWSIRELIRRWFGSTGLTRGQLFPEPVRPTRPDWNYIGDGSIGLPPSAYDPAGAGFYGVMIALAVGSVVEAFDACSAAAEALRLLGQHETYIATCRCEISVLVGDSGRMNRIFATDHLYVVVSPVARRAGDPDIVRQAGAALAPHFQGLPLVVMPDFVSSGQAGPFQVGRPPAVFEYGYFAPVATVDRRSPLALRLAFNGALYTALVTQASSEPSGF